MKLSKKLFYIFIILFFLAVILIIIRGDEDTWICQNGQWTQHGHPSKPAPTTFCQ